MATKVLGARVPDDLAEWVKSYAESRGVTTQALLEEAIRTFKEDCEAGVPEFRAAAARQSSVKTPERGVGQCPKRDEGWGHVWASPRVDQDRPCIHCGLKGRLTRPVGVKVEEEPNYLDMATSERAEFFSRLRVPMVSGSGDPKKAWPEGMPPEMAAKAAALRAQASKGKKA